MLDLKEDLRAYFDKLVEEAEMLATEQQLSTRPAMHRMRWVVSAVAAVLVVTLVAIATVVLRGGGDTPTIQTPTSPPHQVSTGRLLPNQSNLVVFMRADASDDEVGAVRRTIVESDAIRRYAFLSHQEALREYRRHTADNPALSEDITADVLPESFRIELRDCSAISDLRAFFEQLPGVDAVQLAAGLSRSLAKKYNDTSKLDDLPPRTLHGTCGGTLPSRAEALREAEAATTTTR